MRVIIRKMGNSQGVILPKHVLAQVGLETEAELVVEKDAIVLRRPQPRARSGWADASRIIAENGDDALVWPEFENADDADLTW